MTEPADSDAFIPLGVPDLSGRERAYLLQSVDDNWVSSAGPFVNGLPPLTGSRRKVSKTWRLDPLEKGVTDAQEALFGRANHQPPPRGGRLAGLGPNG